MVEFRGKSLEILMGFPVAADFTASTDLVVAATLKLCAILDADYDKNGASPNPQRFTVKESRKYLKVIMSDGFYTSVHAFVDRENGNVFKPAGWKAPAKGVRYNLIENPEVCYNNADWLGGYLYSARRRY